MLVHHLVGVLPKLFECAMYTILCESKKRFLEKAVSVQGINV